MFVVIVDDHPLFREGIKAVLCGLDPDVRTAAFACVDELLACSGPPPAPDLVLLDMDLPGVNRLDALRAMRDTFPEASVVVISGDEDPVNVRDAIDHGAAGYIPKTTDPVLTIQALRLVLANGTYMPRSALTSHLTARLPAQDAEVAPRFSTRQLSVLKALLQGKQNKVIARELDIAEGTVKAHLWAVYQTLGVSTRAQAMYRAHSLNLFETDTR